MSQCPVQGSSGGSSERRKARHVFMSGDFFERRARIACKALAEDVGAKEKSDQTGIHCSAFSISLDDELHLLAGAFRALPKCGEL
jgi:hypothetical protein